MAFTQELRAWPVAWPPDRVPARTLGRIPSKQMCWHSAPRKCRQAGSALAVSAWAFHLWWAGSGNKLRGHMLLFGTCYIVLFTVCLGPYRSAGSPSTPSKTGSETRCRRVTGSLLWSWRKYLKSSNFSTRVRNWNKCKMMLWYYQEKQGKKWNGPIWKLMN